MFWNKLRLGAHNSVKRMMKITQAKKVTIVTTTRQAL